MLAGELARTLRELTPEGERVLVGINHSDSGSGMYGTVLVTQATLTITPSGERVVLLAGAAQCSPDDDNPESDSRMLSHPDLMSTLDLAATLEIEMYRDLRVFHTLDHGRNNPEIYADESGFWDSLERTIPAGPRPSQHTMMQDEPTMIDYPAVIDLWNMDDHFHIG